MKHTNTSAALTAFLLLFIGAHLPVDNLNRVPPAQPRALPSIATVLDEQDRLLPGAEGSFAAVDFSMGYAEDGSPVFVPAQQAGTWDTRFTTNLLEDEVYAIAVSGSDVYAGGLFTDAGGDANADRIARWDGTSWNALGTGLNNTVRAIAVFVTDVFVGGQFTDTFDGVTASSRFGIFNDPTVLPVELVTFQALLDGTDVLLSWQTASETSNAGFEVQRREALSANSDEDAWKVLAFVDGHGTTLEPQTSRFRVDDLAPGRHRFRLKQIDFDGAFEYSPEVAMDLREAYLLTPAYPNPFNPQTRFSLMVKRRQEVAVSVYDALGRRVLRLHEGGDGGRAGAGVRLRGGVAARWFLLHPCYR